VPISADMARRGLHLASPLLLLYYLFPPEIVPGVDRRLPVILAVLAVAGFEAFRLLRHLDIPGMRDYERHRLGGYAWGGFGMALGFLFFPPVLHVVTFCGMAWVDPLCAWTKTRGTLYPKVPLLAYIAGAMVLFVLLSPYHSALELRPFLAVPLACVAAVAAIAAEYPKWKATDDDFVMNVAPLMLLTLLVGF